MSEILRYLCEVASGQLPMKEIIHVCFACHCLVYGKQNDYYTIDALLFLWEHRGKTHPSYVRDATAANVKVVSRPDSSFLLSPLLRSFKRPTDSRPRVDQLLNKDRVDPSEVRALNESLTADKIAALKQKRLTHQKTKIAAVDPLRNDFWRSTDGTARNTILNGCPESGTGLQNQKNCDERNKEDLHLSI
ncbi:hypothetical protein ANCDUO_11346 [Ancylostoma duodenale]|uniref:Paf1 complex subunit Cdc73 N-terminal domain-containing protein n=1 Tax=Ancylostoma duodenale TaxID=51022 RepID=A0A0C2GN84_9BILA|nr:hypothetical protein ANCDUO_11346 [Ancylostoma duodenale]